MTNNNKIYLKKKLKVRFIDSWMIIFKAIRQGMFGYDVINKIK